MKYVPIYLGVFLVVYTVILRIGYSFYAGGILAAIRGSALKESWVVLLLFIATGTVAVLFRKKIAASTWTLIISILGFVSYIFLFRNIGVEP